MQQYELKGQTVLLFPIPDNATRISVSYLYNWLCYTLPDTSVHKALPDVDKNTLWRFLCTTSTMTEEQAAELMMVLHQRHGITFYAGYPMDIQRPCMSAILAFHSWLSANNITGNWAILLEEE